MSKTIAIFGFGPGLGLGTARRFGREGFRVAVIGRDADRARAHVATLEREGIGADAFTADLSVETELGRAVDEVTARFGQIDVALHGAAADMSIRSASTLSVDAEALRAPLELKLHSPIWMARALAPAMIERGEGALLFSSGLSESHLQPYLANVGVILGAQRQYVRQLDAELRGTGVYAGLLNIGALIQGSLAQVAVDEHPELIPPGLEITRIGNDELGDHYWRLYTERDNVELDVGFTN